MSTSQGQAGPAVNGVLEAPHAATGVGPDLLVDQLRLGAYEVDVEDDDGEEYAAEDDDEDYDEEDDDAPSDASEHSEEDEEDDEDDDSEVDEMERENRLRLIGEVSSRTRRRQLSARIPRPATPPSAHPPNGAVGNGLVAVAGRKITGSALHDGAATSSSPEDQGQFVEFVLNDRDRRRIRRDLVVAHPDTMLGRMALTELAPTEDASLTYNIQAENIKPAVFLAVLEYYEEGRIVVPHDMELEQVIDACEYFMIPISIQTISCVQGLGTNVESLR